VPAASCGFVPYALTLFVGVLYSIFLVGCSVIRDLIAETTATKDAINEAVEGIDQSIVAYNSMASPPKGSSDNNTGDLFGFDAAVPSVPSRDSTSDDFDDRSYNALYNHAQPPPLPVAATTTTTMYHMDPNPASVGGGFEGAGIMGGAPMLGVPPSATNHDSSNNNDRSRTTTTDSAAAAPTLSFPYNSNSIQSVLSSEEIEDLKSRSREADNVARDAAETKRQLVAQMDELRRVADQAESLVRQYHKGMQDASAKKKKGMFGGGGKNKKDAVRTMPSVGAGGNLGYRSGLVLTSLSLTYTHILFQQKELERLAQDAKTKKDAFLQAQSQVNDANADSQSTQVEADRLRKAAEDAELAAASAASLRETSYRPPAKSNGYSTPASYGLDAGGTAGVTAAYGFSGGSTMGYESDSRNYNPAVMGSGGGISIPTPSSDPYDNPF
jgi:hypothetical protein